MRPTRRGLLALAATVPLSLLDSFYIYDRATLPHIAVTWAGGVVWEGRLEDVAIIPGGLRLMALGYIRGYADAPLSSNRTSPSRLVRPYADAGEQASSSRQGRVASPENT